MEAYSDTSQKPKFFLVVHHQDSDNLKSKLTKICCSGWERYISVLVHRPRASNIESFTSDLIDEFLEFSAECIYYQPGLLDVRALDESGIKHRPCNTVATMFKELSSLLKDVGIHWHSHATREWSKSLLKSSNPDVWVQQFAEIGHKQVGINILKSLKVVSNTELLESFRLPLSEEIGLRIAHAYIHEEEPGSSSIEVKNILEHMHPDGVIIALDLSKDDVFDQLNCDVLYIYEDGIWSGVEVVKRLRRINELRGFKETNLQIVFKYCVTCDAGLSAARLYAVNNAAGRFMFPSAAKNLHFNFFTAGTDSRFSELSERSDESIRAAIDAAVKPYAFASDQIWPDGRDEGIRVCSEIGAQLVKSSINTKNKAPLEEKLQLEKVERLKLGAMGFASTIVFTSSIPKPVLPIMWLNGSISFNEKKITWRPLFWDARRTGTVEHHT